MKNIILVATFILFQVSAFAQDTTCDAGMYFDTGLNRCVLSSKTVENKTEALNCQGLTGDAAQSCFKNIVDGEVSELEASGQVESAKNPKSNYVIPAIVTLGSAYFLLKHNKSFTQCGSISIALMAGAGVTTILGEILAQSKYKSKLKKMEKNYTKRTTETSSSDTNNLEVVNSNQTIAFDYQIEQEKARASAHKTRKTVYTLSTALYTGAVAAAVYEMIAIGTSVKKCSVNKQKKIEKKVSEAEFPESKAYDLSNPLISNNGFFDEYFYITNASAIEISEIVLRKISEVILPSASAQTLTYSSGGVTKSAVITGDTSLTKIGSNAAESISGIEKIAGSPIFRASFSGLLAIYSGKIASKAGKLAKEASARAKAIEELRDNFLANGGAGFANCTESERTKPSIPTCYCYQADGTRNPSRAQSPTCVAVYGSSGGPLAGGTDYGAVGSDLSLTATGCLDGSGQLDANCECNKTNSCSTISGGLNLGNLGNIGGLSQTVSDASNFTTGNISAGNLDDSALERAIANIGKQTVKLTEHPKAKGITKKIDDLGFKIEKSLGNSIKRAAAAGSISPELASFSGGFSNGSDSDKKKIKVAALSPSKVGSSAPTSVNLNTGASSGVSIDDYDFNSKSKGGIKIQDENAQIMDKEFKVDDISNNSSASIFSIISNRYHTTGLRTLFSEDEASNEN